MMMMSMIERGTREKARMVDTTLARGDESVFHVKLA